MPDCVVCVGTGPSQRPLIDAAHALGFWVIGIDRTPDEARVDFPLATSTYDTEAVLAAVDKHPLRSGIRGVLARVSGPAVVTGARLAASLGVPGCGVRFAAASLVKSKLRAAGEFGVSVLEGRLLTAEDAWVSGCDWVLKPDSPLHGKRNVYRVRSAAAYRKAFQAAAEESLNGRVLCQPYRAGSDLGLVVLLSEGQLRWSCFYEELVDEIDGHFGGRGVVGPADDLPVALVDRLLADVGRLAAGWGGDGFIFFSFRRLPAGEVLLYEINPGLCGDGLADRLFKAIWPSCDFFAADVLAMTGQPPALPAPSGRRALLLHGCLVSGVGLDNAALLQLASRECSTT